MGVMASGWAAQSYRLTLWLADQLALRGYTLAEGPYGELKGFYRQAAGVKWKSSREKETLPVTLPTDRWGKLVKLVPGLTPEQYARLS